MTRIAYMTACAIALIMSAGCATVSRGDFCSIYTPIYTSGEDSEETRRQADASNAVWMEFCQPGYAP